MFTVLIDDDFVGSRRSWLAETDYRLALSPDELWAYVEPNLKAGRSPGIDFESTGLNIWTDKIVGTSISFEKGKGIYAPVRHFEGAEYNLPLGKVQEILREIDKAPVLQYWFHTDYDHGIMQHDWGWQPTYGKWRDVMIAVYLEWSDAMNHGLKDSTQRLLDLEMISYQESLGLIKRKGQPLPGFQVVHPLNAPPYACSDSDMTGRLARVVPVTRAIEQQSFVYDLEHRILAPVREGIEAGIPLDGIYARMLDARTLGDIAALELQIREQLQVPPSFNVGSRDQLGPRLKELGIPVTDVTPTGKISTRKTNLAKHAKSYPVVANLIQFAELKTSERNYLRKAIMAEQHFGPRIRLQFNTIGAPTGRMSSGGAGRTQQEAFAKGFANFNGQSWPDAVKKPYLPDVRAAVSTAALNAGDDWVIVAMDYQQVELRICASVARETVWADMFRQGIDIHAGNATFIEGKPLDQITDAERKKGKTASFAIVYQATAPTVAKQAGISEEEAEKLIERVLGKCPRLAAYIEAVKQSAEANGFVETYFRRRRQFRGFFSADRKYTTKEARKLRNRGWREAVNATIQGAAADVFKIAIHKVSKLLKSIGAEQDWVPIMWVHDEMVSLVRRSRLYELAPQVKAAMEFEVKGWSVPLRVDTEVGWNWGIGKPPKDFKPGANRPQNWGYGLLSWEDWCARYPPETATQPLLCWLPESVYGVAPDPSTPGPDDEGEDDDAEDTANSIEDLFADIVGV